MFKLLLGSIIVSFFHSAFPSHWLPTVVVANTEKWTSKKTLRFTTYLALAHVLSTLVVGLLIYWVGVKLSANSLHDMQHVVAVTFIVLGVYFLLKPSHHHHDHSHKSNRLFKYLLFTMLLSPCVEILPFFLGAAEYGIIGLLEISLVYIITSIVGIVLMTFLGFKSLKRFDHQILHKWERFILSSVFILIGILTLTHH